MRPTVWGILALSLLVITGCQSVRTEENPAKGSELPKSGGILNLNASVDPNDWDPTSSTAQGIEYAYNRLLRYKVGPDIAFTDAVLEPELAERWEISPGGQTFTFHLRKGAKFANLPPVNGRELVAADVKFSLEYFARIGEFKGKGPTQLSDYTQGMVSVEAPDPYTAIVQFKEAFLPFLSYVGAERMPILAREVYEAQGHFKDTVVGSGPFQLDRAASQKGTLWTWRKNATYWEPGKPYLDEVRFLVIPDASTWYAAFQAKQLDVLLNSGKIIGYNDAQQVHAATPQAIMGEYEPHLTFLAYLNTRNKPLDDIRIRQAISLAVDNDEMMRTFQGGRGSRLMPGIFNGYFSQDEIRKLLLHDTEKARALVVEAGYSQGVDLEMTFSTGSGSPPLNFLELFQAQLKRANINLALKPQESVVYSQNRRQGNYLININVAASSGGLRWDPEQGVYRFHSKSDNNYWGINDPSLDRLLEDQRKEVDFGKRRELIRQVGLRIVEKAYSIGFYTSLEYVFWHPHVKNVYRNVNAAALPITDVWLDK